MGFEEDLQLTKNSIKTPQNDLDLERHLYKLIELHDLSIDKAKIHSFIFSLFESAKNRMLLVNFLKKIKRHVKSVDLDIIKYLRSEDYFERRVGIRLVEIFWSLFENDIVVVFTIRHEKAFYRLFEKHPKWSILMKKQLNKWVNSAQPVDTVKLNRKNKKSHYNFKEIYRRLYNLSASLEIKRELENFTKDLEYKEKIVFKRFEANLNDYFNRKSSEAVPGLSFELSNESKDFIENHCELEMLGMMHSRLFKGLEMVYDMLTRNSE